MKPTICLSLFAAVILTTTGCFSYERRATRAVVVETTPVVTETTVRTLPTGYRTRVYRGTTYYYTQDVVYRSRPTGDYVVVTRPW